MMRPDEPTPASLDRDEAFVRGVELYASGAYWHAHEAWEDLWRSARDEQLRLLLQGLIQVAAALYKLVERRDADACLRLLARGVAKLDALPGVLRGVDVGAFREGARGCAASLARERSVGDRFDRSLAPRVAFV